MTLAHDPLDGFAGVLTKVSDSRAYQQGLLRVSADPWDLGLSRYLRAKHPIAPKGGGNATDDGLPVRDSGGRLLNVAQSLASLYLSATERTKGYIILWWK